MMPTKPLKKPGAGVVAVVALDGGGDVGIVEGLPENVLEEIAGGDHLTVPFLNRFNLWTRWCLNRFKIGP
jgi:hypothetical protein